MAELKITYQIKQLCGSSYVEVLNTTNISDEFSIFLVEKWFETLEELSMYLDIVNDTYLHEVTLKDGDDEYTSRVYEALVENIKYDKMFEIVEQRIEEDWVLFQTKTDRSVDCYQGGLSDELFNHPTIQNYLRNSFEKLSGYFGIEDGRQFESDKIVENVLRNHFDIEMIASWLVSDDCRKFVEFIEWDLSMGELDFIKSYLDKAAPSIYNHLLIVTSPHYDENISNSYWETHDLFDNMNMLKEESGFSRHNFY